MEITAYIEDNFELSKRLNANLGVNLSLFHTQGKSYIYAQPRVSLRYDLTKGYAIKASYSQMVQYVHLLASNNIPLPTDLWVPITKIYVLCFLINIQWELIIVDSKDGSFL